MQTDSKSKNTETSEKKFIIDVRSLSKKYGDHFAVNDLNLKVAEGEIFGFLGHNGAGKTTTVNMLTTLLQPTSGGAFVAGFNIVKESVEVRKRIGYLPENVQLYDSMTAYENLEYFAKLSGITKPKERILKVLDFLDANGYRDKKIGELSKWTEPHFVYNQLSNFPT
jgi:ABC-2 type transport system ATP-binding protein